MNVRPFVLITLGFGWLAVDANLMVGNVILRETRLGIIAQILDRLPPAVAGPIFFMLSGRAWYRTSTDTIGMPARNAFNSTEEYYSTLFHELTHSTGHSKRIGREGIEKLNTFGSESYSKEELIAEMGAAMLSGVAGIERRTLSNSAAYLKSWIDVLKSDSRMVVSAVGDEPFFIQPTGPDRG